MPIVKKSFSFSNPAEFSQPCDNIKRFAFFFNKKHFQVLFLIKAGEKKNPLRGHAGYMIIKYGRREGRAEGQNGRCEGI